MALKGFVANKKEIASVKAELDRLRSVVNFPEARKDRIYRSLHQPPAEDFVFDGRDEVKESLWLQLCAALDVIGDSLWALEAYQESIAKEDYEITGMNYLRLYGVLQAIFLQQDALRLIGDAIDIPIDFKKDYWKLNQIRTLRNLAVGHPVRWETDERVIPDKKRNVVSHVFLTRTALYQDSFESQRTMRSGSEIKRHFIPEIIKDQLEGAREILKLLTTKIEAM